MIAARPILVVEDDRAQQGLLVEGFTVDREFDVHVAATLRDAEALLGDTDARFDAVVLSLEIEGGNAPVSPSALTRPVSLRPTVSGTKPHRVACSRRQSPRRGHGHRLPGAREIGSRRTDGICNPWRAARRPLRLAGRFDVREARGHSTSEYHIPPT
jgi:hypothetical protein